MENKILAEKSYMSAFVAVFSMLVAIFNFVILSLRYHYLLLLTGVFFVAVSVVLWVLHFRAPRVLAEYDGEKILLYPERGVKLQLLPEEILNVSKITGQRRLFLWERSSF